MEILVDRTPFLKKFYLVLFSFDFSGSHSNETLAGGTQLIADFQI